jgi:putative tryptophan/tyrosine transport system substrate-binding protein
MTACIGRREFITLLAGAGAWPLAARAQQAAMPVVGFLHAQGQNDRPNVQAAFRRGLSEAGYVEIRNVAIEYRFAENRHDRLPALAADLVGRKINAIAATGGGASVLAAMAATKTIPIVFTTGGDPVRDGYVASLNRPGGNATGVSWFSNLVAGKGLGLLHELVPNAAVIAVLVNPTLPESARMPADSQEAARSLGRHCWLSMPARQVKSTMRSLPCANGALARFLWVAIHFFPAGGNKLLHWRRVTPSRRCTPTANLLKKVGWRATATTP